MNIEQLQYVLEVAKTTSISLASQNLHITQAAISQSITNLEKELDIKLFKRNRSGCTLTGEGKNLIEDVSEIVQKIEEFKEKAKLQKNILTGELKIAATPSLFMTVLSDTLSPFKRDYPDINIEISTDTIQGVLRDIDQGKVDIGLCVIDETVKHKESYHYKTMLNGSLNVCVGKNSPLANHKILTPKEILDYPIVLPNGNFMKSLTNKLFREYGPMKILFESNNNEVLKRAVSADLGIGFFLDLALEDDPYINSGNIINIPLIEFAPEFSYGWVRLKNRYMPLPEKEFLKYINSTISEKYS